MACCLPKLVLALTHNHDAWIVGSAADPHEIEPRDYDVLVPFYEWGPASALIPGDARVNSFGGWKCVSDGVEVDVWPGDPGDLGWLMQRVRAQWAWHPKSGVRLEKR